MKSFLFALAFCFATFSALNAGSPSSNAGYKVGDTARDFKLKDVSGNMVSMADNRSAKGFIVIFTCNHCPYSVAYEDRIIALHSAFAPKGYPVIAINPNDPGRQPEDSFENMQVRAKEKKFNFPYLLDDTQEIASTYGATRTPHVFLLQKQSDGTMKVAYIGAIDNNTESADNASEKYVETAVAALEANKQPSPDFTKAVGCTIKWKAQ